jgi:DNA-binding PadR family transcriptional regulator
MDKERTTHLGDFEELVLLAVLRLGENAYGVTIRDAVEEAINRKSSTGAIGATLERLARKGLVSSRWGEATPERGGRRKKYFRIEGAGVRALEASELARTRLRAGIRPGFAYGGS